MYLSSCSRVSESSDVLVSVRSSPLEETIESPREIDFGSPSLAVIQERIVKVRGGRKREARN
jgi:hypothetical protein